MDVDEVIGTACALAGEVVEVGQACLTAAVGNGRGAELDGAVVRLQEVSIYGDALRWRKVSTGRTVWLVRAVDLVSTVGGDTAGWRLYSRKQSFGSTFDQDWNEVLPLVILQAGIDHDRGNVGEIGIDLIATNHASVGPVRDIRTSDVKVAPSNLGLGVVEKSPLAGTTSRGLGWVLIAARKSTSYRHGS